MGMSGVTVKIPRIGSGGGALFAVVSLLVEYRETRKSIQDEIILAPRHCVQTFKKLCNNLNKIMKLSTKILR